MWFRRCGYVYLCVLCLAQIARVSSDDPVWNWECKNNEYCVKKPLIKNTKTNQPIFTLEECKMFCGDYGVIWPRPTILTNFSKTLTEINVNDINFNISKKGKSDDLLADAIQRFKSLVLLTVPESITVKSGNGIDIFLHNENPNVTELTLDMDESYTLTVTPEEGARLTVTIVGGTFFGVRHGLETLSQFFVYDDNNNHILLVRDVEIKDKPAFTYRGLLLDTSRNYFSVHSIKNTINAMAAVKLNTFHWHITDSQSFPLVLDKRPEMAKYGAYSPSKVYTKKDIREVVEFAAARGVRVVPELDAPAHVGEGWPQQLTTCFKYKPWIKFCKEPPCGQLNPIKDEVYDYLEDIYTEMAETFKTDLFHMGGDEVSKVCWTLDPEIRAFMKKMRWNRNETGFLKLWSYFQQKAKIRAYKAFGSNITLILWTSPLTDFKNVNNYLPKNEYIIQVWTTSNDTQIQRLLSKGYKLIMSHYDAMYLDCGFDSWVKKGPGWCAYAGWQTIYDNDLAQGVQRYRDLILGGEAAVWTEQIDEAALDSRAWPRAAALAERLWSNPGSSYEAAVGRLYSMRKRLISMGIKADSFSPEWCNQNEGSC